MRILFLAPRHPHPVRRGDQRRVLHLVEELSRRAAVTLIAFGEGALPDCDAHVIPVALRRSALVAANLRAADPRLPLQTRLYLSHAMRQAVTDELRRSRSDIVHCTLARMAPYLPPPGPWHRHLDFVDALSLNMATRARTSRGPARAVFAAEARLMRAYEAACIGACDSSSLVSEADRRQAPWLGAATVVPNGVDTRCFPFAAPLDRPPSLVFFGNLGYYHNVEPARFVAEEVLPALRRRVPRATLRIVGARPAAAVRRLAAIEGVEVVGPVAQMACELHRAAVAIVPMFTGSGMKNKVLEAFSAGTPVVTNAAGIEGVDGARAGVHYLSGEHTDALVDRCAALLADPGRRLALAHAAHTLIKRSYSWGAQAERLLEVYAHRPAGARLSMV